MKIYTEEEKDVQTFDELRDEYEKERRRHATAGAFVLGVVIAAIFTSLIWDGATQEKRRESVCFPTVQVLQKLTETLKTPSL